MRRMSACRQLLIGMSISRYLPPIGTAGFGSQMGEGKEPGADAAAKDDRQHITHAASVARKKAPFGSRGQAQ